VPVGGLVALLLQKNTLFRVLRAIFHISSWFQSFWIRKLVHPLSQPLSNRRYTVQISWQLVGCSFVAEKHAFLCPLKCFSQKNMLGADIFVSFETFCKTGRLAFPRLDVTRSRPKHLTGATNKSDHDSELLLAHQQHESRVMCRMLCLASGKACWHHHGDAERKRQILNLPCVQIRRRQVQ
jgi:hypothetical protein